MSTNADDEMPRRYALRQQSRVRREIETHLVRMIELTGEEIARDWYDQLINAIASLAQNPRRWPVIPEQSRFRYETRHLMRPDICCTAARRVVRSGGSCLPSPVRSRAQRTRLP